MAWQEQLEALEIDNSNMPNMIRKVVKELYEFQSASERISKILDRDDLSEAKREQYEEELEQLDEAIEQQERVIENKIALWEKNKDSYAERIKKMHEANAKKKGGVVKTEATQQQAPPSAPAGVEVQKPNEPTPPASEPKKKGGFGWIALGLVVAVLTAGAVIINKDE
jgi:uncharacterized protein (DUF3084 family)